jgi:hypothetical protein
LCVRGINFASFYDFDIWFWNLYDSVVFFFHFILIQETKTTCDIKYIKT